MRAMRIIPGATRDAVVFWHSAIRINIHLPILRIWNGMGWDGPPH